MVEYRPFKPIVVGSNPTGPNMSEIRTLTIDNKGETITLEPKESIQIELEGIPSAGYRWHHVPLLKTSYRYRESFKANSEDYGAGGTFTFQIRPNAPGIYDMIFEYSRAWENKPPSDTFRVRLVVEK